MKSLQYTFTAGEIDPEVHGRVDLDAYRNGLALCQNFTVLPHGPAARRPGFRFCSQAFKDNTPCRLIPFVGTSGGAAANATTYDNAVLIELGDLYARFHVNGAPVLDDVALTTVTVISGNTLQATVPVTWADGQWVRLSGTDETGLTPFLDQTYVLANVTVGPGGSFSLRHTAVNLPVSLAGAPGTPVLLQAGRVYTLTSPYAAADLPALRWAQSPDFLTIAHSGYATRELYRTSLAAWAFRTVAFSPTIAPPSTVSATPTGGGTLVHTYVVTSLAADLVTESLQSSVASASNTLTTAGNSNLVSWSPVSGATYYTVYKLAAGVYGYLGRTKATTLIDSGQLPDTATSPPVLDITLNSAAGDYPQAVTYFEQRRVFAATYGKPSTIWATRNGTDANLSSSMPLRDDDALVFKVAAQQRGTIQHLVPLNDLLALTRSGYHRVFAADTGPLTYRSVNVKPQGSAGANDVQPVVTPDSVLYVQSQGSRLREISYKPEGQGTYTSLDVMLLSQHLVQCCDITALAYTYMPDQVAWAVRSDGVLLGMTHVPEHRVYAWHRHVTDGTFESVAVIPEGGQDVVYVVVKRSTGGGGGKNAVRYIERLHPRTWSSPLALEDAFFVDAGVTYSGAATTTVGKLWHLEGRYVNGLADGAPIAEDNATVFVQNGQITLDAPASKVHVGFGYESRLQTLPMVSDRVEASARGKTKSIRAVDVVVSNTSGMRTGQTFTDLYEQPDRTTDLNYDTVPPMFTGAIRIDTGLGWETGGAVCVQQDRPLPCTVVSIVPDVAMGD